MTYFLPRWDIGQSLIIGTHAGMARSVELTLVFKAFVQV